MTPDSKGRTRSQQSSRNSAGRSAGHPDAPAGPELLAYRLHAGAPPLVCAPSSRAWMDATDERFAYRCLPLLIANQAGWFVLNDCHFEAIWDGKQDPSGVRIRHLSKHATGSVTSHFGDGIITWHISYLFRTPAGYNLLVRGPSNYPKDGVQALEGIVESDWSYATFTMNWKLTRTDHWVQFEKGEPICMLVPQRRGELETFRPVLRDLKDNPELSEGHTAWSQSRSEFLATLRQGGPEAADAKWQKHYFQGRSPHGATSTAHQTVLALQPFPAPERRPEQDAPSRPAGSGKRPLQRPDYRLEEKFGKEILLYHPGKTEVLHLNATASLLWRLCNGQRTPAEITELLREAFPDAAATIDQEVEATLREFAEHHVVEFV